MRTLVLLITVIAIATAEDAGTAFNSIMSGISEVDEKYLQKCVDNGDMDTFVIAKAASSKLVQCFAPIKDELNSIMHSVLMGKGVDEQARQMCKTSLSLNHMCYQKFMSELSPCLSDSDIRAMELYLKLRIASDEHNCKDNGETFAAALQMNELVCFGKHTSVLHTCMAPLLTLLKQNGGESFIPMSRALLGNGCSIYKNIGPCIQKFLPCPGFSKLLVGGMNGSAEILTPCPNELSGQNYEATTISIITKENFTRTYPLTIVRKNTNTEMDEINVLKSIQTLLKSIAETSKRQLDLQTTMDARDTKAQHNQEEAFNSINSMMKKILYSIRQ